MAINLSRNTKVYFTTNVDPNTGAVKDAATGYTAYSASNLFEIGVLDGYSFSQNTQNQSIQVNEAGQNPVRGQRSFNTQLDPVDFSFSQYARPYAGTTNVDPQERVLWNALFGAANFDVAGTGVAVSSITRATTASPTATVICAAAVTQTVNGVAAVLAAGDVLNVSGCLSANQSTWNQASLVQSVPGTGTYVVEMSKAPSVAAGTTATTSASTKAFAGQWAPGPKGTATGQFSYTHTMGSNKNLFQRFGLIFVVDQVVYAIDNCFMDQLSIDFGLDQIATMAWTGKGTKLTQLTTSGLAGTAGTFASTATENPSTAPYITNKLSTMQLVSNIGGADFTGSTAYTVAITGGNLTIANNVSYLVPSNLGVINQAIGYYPGQRSITGNVTAYLRTGESFNSSGDLLKNMLSLVASGSVSAIEPKFRLQLEVGGSVNATRIEFEMPGATITVPAVNIADVVATTINFTAQAFQPDIQASQVFDLTRTNELQVRYFTV